LPSLVKIGPCSGVDRRTTGDQKSSLELSAQVSLKNPETIEETTLFSIPRNIKNNVFDLLLLLYFSPKILLSNFFFNFTPFIMTAMQ
jgi:hypothetical protein